MSTGWADAAASAAAALAGAEIKATPQHATFVGDGLKAALHASADQAGAALAAAKAAARANGTLALGRTVDALETAATVAREETLYFVTPTPLVVPAPPSGPTPNISAASPAATAYSNMRARYRNTKYDGVRPGPATFHMPATPKGLADTIKSLNAAGTRWVVRSGGHSYEANALPSGTDAAVVDMARFAGLKVSRQKKMSGEK